MSCAAVLASNMRVHGTGGGRHAVACPHLKAHEAIIVRLCRAVILQATAVESSSRVGTAQSEGSKGELSFVWPSLSRPCLQTFLALYAKQPCRYLVLQHGLRRDERLAHDLRDLRPQRIKVVPLPPHPLRKCTDGPLAAGAALLRIPAGRVRQREGEICVTRGKHAPGWRCAMKRQVHHAGGMMAKQVGCLRDPWTSSSASLVEHKSWVALVHGIVGEVGVRVAQVARGWRLVALRAEPHLRLTGGGAGMSGLPNRVCSRGQGQRPRALPARQQGAARSGSELSAPGPRGTEICAAGCSSCAGAGGSSSLSRGLPWSKEADC